MLFLVTLSAPVMAMLLGFRPDNYLNRTLSPFPELTLEGLAKASYFDDLDSFIEDSFPVRPNAIALRAAFSYRLFGISPNPQVVAGRGGWLFFAEEVEPRCAFSADDVLEQVDRLTGAFTTTGQAFRFMVAPDKRTVYPEQLAGSDGGVEKCTDVARVVLRNGMAERADQSVDLWTPVLGAKARGGEAQLYWAQDTHWNVNGALAAIQSVVESFTPGVWSPDTVVAEPASGAHLGDLMLMLGLDDLESLPQATVERSFQPLEAVPGTMRFGAVGEGPVVPGKTLIVGDSFFLTMAGLFAPWFEDLTFVDLQTVAGPEVARQLAEAGADNVILERVERAAYVTDYVAFLAPLVRELGGGDLAGGDLGPGGDAVSVASSLPVPVGVRPTFLDLSRRPPGEGACVVDTVNGLPADDGAWTVPPTEVRVSGWAFDYIEMAPPQATYLRLRNEDGLAYFIEAEPRRRPDVAEGYETPDLEDAGFAARFSASSLAPGEYLLSVVMDTPTGGIVCGTGERLVLEAS